VKNNHCEKNTTALPRSQRILRKVIRTTGFKDGELGEEYEDGEYEDLEVNNSNGGFREWLYD